MTKKSFKLQVGELELEIQALAAGELRNGLLDQIEAIGRAKPSAQLGGMIDVLGEAIRRSHPAVTDDVIGDCLDFRDVQDAFTELMQVSRLTSGEAAAAPSPTGPESTGSSAPPADSVSTPSIG